MSWLRLDDDMLDHPKWVRAIRDGGSAALHLWVVLTSWCSRHLTDGVVPHDIMPTLTRDWRSRDRNKALSALEAHELIATSDPEGVQIVGYLERNPSRASVLAERNRRADAQRNRRAATREPDASQTEATPEPNPSQNEADSGHGLATVWPPLGSSGGLSVDTDTEQSPDVSVVVTGHALASVPACNDVPARPGPYTSHKRGSSRAHVAKAGPEPAGTRTLSLPSSEPTQEYLDAALMAGVGPEQARSTWAHYWGAGLPSGGVERLTPWLVQRAKERATQLARASPRVSAGRAAPVSVEPKSKHARMAAHYGIDIAAIVAELHDRKTVETLGTDIFHEHLEKALAREAKRKVDAGEVPAPKPRSVSR